jgi:hypothetical protein
MLRKLQSSVEDKNGPKRVSVGTEALNDEVIGGHLRAKNNERTGAHGVEVISINDGESKERDGDMDGDGDEIADGAGGYPDIEPIVERGLENVFEQLFGKDSGRCLVLV